jgi:type IV secretion system protein TrbG
MDPRCSVKRGLPLPHMSLLAVMALTTVATISPTCVEARGRAKAEPTPSASSQRRTPARPVTLTRRPTQIAIATSPVSGPAAIRAANAEALAPSRADGFVNAAQVFPYETGRVFEIWTAPLRITTISLEPGETITN